VREEAKYPEDRSGAAAIDGTHTHTLLNWCLSQPDNMIGDPKSRIGLMMSDDDGEFMVQGDRASRVQFALDYIMARKIEMMALRIHTEERVSPISVFKRDDLGGTCDVILVGMDTLEIIDYKDGNGIVDAKDNAQMEQYLVGYLAPWLHTESKLPWSKVRMTIIQPKLRERGMKGIDYHEIDADKVLDIVHTIQQQASATDPEDAPLIPGSHCDYCKHKGACTALSGAAMQASGITFANLDVAQQAADKEPTSMTDDQIREIVEAAPLIRQMLEGAEKEALRRFEAGHPISGLKAVKGRGSRSWALDEESMADKLKRMGMPKDTIWKTSLITVAQAEKIKWQKRDGTEDSLSPRQLKTLQTEYVKKSDGKLTIVPESDEREAVITTAEHLFDVVAPVVQTETLPSWLS
jgi:hypothetical protein